MSQAIDSAFFSEETDLLALLNTECAMQVRKYACQSFLQCHAPTMTPKQRPTVRASMLYQSVFHRADWLFSYFYASNNHF